VEQTEREKNIIVATTNYGNDFLSIIEKENILGVQFHPEKSHKNGIKILRNSTISCLILSLKNINLKLL
jgi:imidazoleglycerol phosphate synthase glutamine amidotransferase subunit HisH